MNNEELKKKIVDIALHAEWTDMFGDHNSIGKYAANAIADAIIAAGIGDVKEAEAEANRYEMLYKLQNRDMALAERRAHDAEHRAKVLGRTLAIMKGKGLISGVVDDYIVQAEKELAEERKDEQN
jgi:hypothetical protein